MHWFSKMAIAIETGRFTHCFPRHKVDSRAGGECRARTGTPQVVVTDVLLLGKREYRPVQPTFTIGTCTPACLGSPYIEEKVFVLNKSERPIRCRGKSFPVQCYS